MAYFARLTAAGRAAVAAAIVSGEALSIVDMAIGDGGGAPYDPTGDETDLVNERARVPVETVARDVDTPSLVRIAGIVPADEGGFWVREVGLFDAARELVAIGGYPPAYKPTIAEGASYDLEISVDLAVSTDADVTISETSGDFYATRDWVRAAADYFAVISATITAPPGAPADGEQYLVPDAATGLWAGMAGKIALWRGAFEGWQFIAPRVGALATIGSTGRVMRLSSAGWRTLGATTEEAITGLDEELIATAKGVREFFDANRAMVALNSATTLAPPAEPAHRDAYLIPVDAAGLWAGKAGKIAVWSDNAPTAWVYHDPPAATLAMAADTAAIWKNTAGGWRTVAANLEEHLAGGSNTLLVTPAGLIHVIETTRDATALVSATTLAPPAAPAHRDAYLIPVDAAGAWAGKAGKIAVWSDNEPAGWIFYEPRQASLAVAADTNRLWRRSSGGWREVAASLAEHYAPPSGDLLATAEGAILVGERLRHFAAVSSATTTAPPPEGVGWREAFLVPDDATGAWAGQDGRVVSWDEVANGWVAITPPVGAHVLAADTGLIWRKTGDGWRKGSASIEEHLAGTSENLIATPAGVKAMINQFISETPETFFQGMM